MNEQEDSKDVEELQGVDQRFHEVVRVHGRALWVLVFNANMAKEALGRLSDLARKHGSRGGEQAVGLLLAVLTEQAGEYVKAKGWTKEEVEECERDTFLAVQQEKGRIQLLN